VVGNIDWQNSVLAPTLKTRNNRVLTLNLATI